MIIADGAAGDGWVSRAQDVTSCAGDLWFDGFEESCDQGDVVLLLRIPANFGRATCVEKRDSIAWSDTQVDELIVTVASTDVV